MVLIEELAKVNSWMEWVLIEELAKITIWVEYGPY
jgi:hypothetical protein